MSKKEFYFAGMKDAIPIMLVYFAVSFSFGMIASNMEFSPLSSSVMSLTNLTSAGQFASLSIIAASGPIFELVLSQFIINLRYSLMSLSLSQKLDAKEPIVYRFIAAFGITDEIFAIAVSHDQEISAFYCIGAMSVAIPGWVFGTFLGAILGNILPGSIVSALSVAIYAMFIGIVIPPSRKDRGVLCAVLTAVVFSSMFYYLPGLKNVSSGFATIFVTVISAAICATRFQRGEESHG